VSSVRGSASGTGSGEAGAPRSGERGSVTVVAAAVLAVVIVGTMGVADVGKAFVARTHARAAADAAALAAAQELAVGTGRDPAAWAAEYAERNGATLTACTCAAGSTEAVVSVTVPVGHLLLLPGDRMAIASARAVVDFPGTASPEQVP
jgi:secretion/DNA translocation related TadE-like protein